MSDTILAVDLGRYKSVACAYDRRPRGHTFRTIDTTPAEVDQLLARHPGAVVVVEACANAGWVHDRAVAAGHPVKVANTAAEAWKFKYFKRKTGILYAATVVVYGATVRGVLDESRGARPPTGPVGHPPLLPPGFASEVAPVHCRRPESLHAVNWLPNRPRQSHFCATTTGSPTSIKQPTPRSSVRPR